jgi:hypothetical protein
VRNEVQALQEECFEVRNKFFDANSRRQFQDLYRGDML